MGKRLIYADDLSSSMYHEAFETDTDMQKWDSGCWIRYKMFENQIEKMPTVEAIPVERIEKLVVRIKELSNDNPSYWNVCDVVDRQKVLDTIEEMMEDWRKENGTETN